MLKRACAVLLVAVGVLAASNAYASPVTLINADFSSGLTGWTTFTTAHGALGPSPLPTTESFDVTGGGASLAAKFQVGQADGAFCCGPPYNEGGGIFQSFTSGAGSLSLAFNVASFDNAALSGGDNADGGVFSLLLDGTSVATYDFGSITNGTTERSALNALVGVGAGTHEIRLLMTRQYSNGNQLGYTPFQYIDNVSLDLAPATTAPVPEPASLFLLGTGLAVLARRRFTKHA